MGNDEFRTPHPEDGKQHPLELKARRKDAIP